MSLMDDFRAVCVLMTPTRVPDGSGGQMTTYTDGVTFTPAIAFDGDSEPENGEKTAARSVYTVSCFDMALSLPYHTVFRRLDDGKVFRVTSDDEKRPPKSATFRFFQVTAEEWSIPK